MYICRVQGKCVSTIKNAGLSGFGLVTVQRLSRAGNPAGEVLVAVDTIGCSVGETVLVTRGSAARAALGTDSPSDMAIVGIVDTYDCNG